MLTTRWCKYRTRFTFDFFMKGKLKFFLMIKTMLWYELVSKKSYSFYKCKFGKKVLKIWKTWKYVRECTFTKKICNIVGCCRVRARPIVVVYRVVPTVRTLDNHYLIWYQCPNHPKSILSISSLLPTIGYLMMSTEQI